MWAGAMMGGSVGSPLYDMVSGGPENKLRKAVARKAGSQQKLMASYEKFFGKNYDPGARVDPEELFVYGTYNDNKKNTNYLSNTAFNKNKNTISRIFRKNSE